MDIYLSGISSVRTQLLSGELNPRDIFALESFYSLKNWEKPFINQFGKFMLDSGAFTFRVAGKSNKGGKIDWERYADAYADFVREFDIKLFFELDIDNITGYDYVLKLRDRIEARANRQSIPVWHTNRGKQDFLDMCKRYSYVAIGGIVGASSVHRIDEKYFPWFIKTAHENGARIHGLGYTNTKKLAIYHWDSVDSTSWTSAGRYGQLHFFYRYSINQVSSKEKGKKVRVLRSYKDAMWHNFKEWIKFQKYAYRNL